ncbi:hypothetical protein BJ138DRAFT_1105092 [Hygrophoropsis aurantiaca]|uniref:Uncharacterized protein n=1 Tax=Hygrophoropsis aurantiaca TaxID=72124 RepID=A0ACB7ZZU9_9AGAM|nr:hypothetical protein BJ138DRAFT_1105092 [Hygrophoropsis aurantiaca]
MPIHPSCSWSPLAFEYCLTCNDEFHFVWGRGRWNVVNISFVLTRYVPIIELLTTNYNAFTPQVMKPPKCHAGHLDASHGIYVALFIPLSQPAIDDLNSAKRTKIAFATTYVESMDRRSVLTIIATIYGGYLAPACDLPSAGRLMAALCQGNLMYALSLLGKPFVVSEISILILVTTEAISTINIAFYHFPSTVSTGPARCFGLTYHVRNPESGQG